MLCREDTPGDKRLVAYLCPATERSVSVDELRSYLQASLPSYMIPSAIVPLAEFPLMPNGKLDRAAVPLPDREAQSELSYVAPRDELEKQIAAIWQDVLQLDRVGLYDNFFDLGGNSLLVTQVVSRVRDRLGVNLSIADHFSNSRLDELATWVENARWVLDKQSGRKDARRVSRWEGTL